MSALIETLDTGLPLGDLDTIWLSPDERASGIMIQRDYRRGSHPPVEYRIVSSGRLMAERYDDDRDPYLCNHGIGVTCEGCLL